MTSVYVHTDQILPEIRDAVASAICSTLAEGEEEWESLISEDPENNAWDVEIEGPDRFHWSRRFSGADRDAAVIATAVNDAIMSSKRAA